MVWYNDSLLPFLPLLLFLIFFFSCDFSVFHLVTKNAQLINVVHKKGMGTHDTALNRRKRGDTVFFFVVDLS